MKAKSEKMIICGLSGSGKDHLQRELIKKGLPFSPKVTTRPKRDKETNGKDYYFIKNEEFLLMLKNDLILTYQSFDINGDNWHYGITKENFYNNNLFIMTPHEISLLSPKDRKKCFVVYLDIDHEIRKSRVLKRKDMHDSVTRRFEADLEDFKNFSDYDMRVTDSEFEVDTIYDLMF